MDKVSSTASYRLSHRPLISHTIANNAILVTGTDHILYKVHQNRVILYDGGHNDWVTSACMIGNSIYSSGMDSKLVKWTSPKSHKVQFASHSASIPQITSDGDSRLISCSYDGSLRVYSTTLSSNFTIQPPAAPIPIQNFGWTRESDKLYYTTSSGTLFVYDISSNIHTHTIQISRSKVSRVFLNEPCHTRSTPLFNDSRDVISTVSDSQLCIIDTRITPSAGRVTCRLQLSGEISCVASTGLNTFALTIPHDIQIRQYDLRSPKLPVSMTQKTAGIRGNGGDCCYALESNGKAIVSCWGDGVVECVQGTRSRELVADNLQYEYTGCIQPSIGLKNALRSVSFVDDSVIGVGDDGILAIWSDISV